VRTVRPQQPALRLHPHQLLPHICRAQVRTHGLSYPSLLFLHSFHPYSSLHYFVSWLSSRNSGNPLHLSCYPLPQRSRTMRSISVVFAPYSLPFHSLYSTLLHSSLYTLHYSTLFIILSLSPLSIFNYHSLYFHLSIHYSSHHYSTHLLHSSLYSYCGVG
jgi:hypothetical protein